MNETTAVLTTEYQPPSDPSPAETDEFTPTNGTEVETEKRKKPRISHIILKILEYSAAPIVSLIFFTVYLIYFGIYPYGDMIMSSYDMLAQVCPFAEHFFDVIEGKSSLLYSFSIAGGADVFGTLAYCMISPFSFIFLLGGRGMVNYMVSFVLGAKIAAIALSATYFLRKAFPHIPAVPAIVLAILYTYSGYFHVANTYINWLDFMIILPLAVLAFRHMMQTGKYLYFSLCIAAMIYACFSIACFSLLIIFPILMVYVLTVVEKPLRREAATKICMSLLIAVGIALPLIVAALMAYVRSGRNTGLFENLGNDLDSLHLYRKLSYVMCDVTFVVLGFYYFIFAKKRDGTYLFLLIASAFIFAPVFIDEVCLLLNAGSYMSYSLRFGFLNSLLGLYVSCKAIENYRFNSPNKPYKWPISCIIATILIAICGVTVFLMQDMIDNGEASIIFKLDIFKEGSPLYELYKEAEFGASYSAKFAHSLGGMEVLTFTLIAFGLSLIIVMLLQRFKIMNAQVTAATMIIISLISAGFNSYHMVAGNYNTMITYDQVQVVLDEIEDREGDFDGFRIKSYDDIMTADAPLTQHYRSFTVFSSVIDSANFIAPNYFLYGGNGVNSMKSNNGNVLSDCLFGYKYAFRKANGPAETMWTRVYESDPFDLYENTLVFPTAFRIPGGEYTATEGNYAEQLNTFYTWLGGEGDLMVTGEPTSVRYYEEEDYYKINFPQTKGEGNVFIVADIPEGVTLRYSSSGSYDETYNYEMKNDYARHLGYTKNGRSQVYSIKVLEGEVDSSMLKDIFRITSMQYSKVEELSAKLRERAAEVDFGRNTITATTTANEGEYLFINYVAIDGWKCLVNGKETDLIENDLQFIAVPLTEGENRIELKYVSPYPKYLLLGGIVGCILIAAVVLAFKYYQRIKRWFEWLATTLAAMLSVAVVGFGFIYPIVLFVIKLVKTLL